MRKLFFDLDQDDREYWANYVTNSGYQVADNQSFYSPSSNDNSFVSNSPSNNPSNQPTVGLAPNKGATNVQSNNSSSSSNSKGVTCYNCVNGVVEGRSYQNLSVCPQGETTDPNPCVTVLPVPQVICNSCQNGYPIGNIFDNECPQGWTTDKDPCKDTIIQGCMDPSAANYNQSAVVDDGMCVYVDPPISNVQFDNICYSCIDGSPKGTVIPSEVAGFCPEGYSQDMKGVCPKEETKDNNDLILYLAIGIGAYLLIK